MRTLEEAFPDVIRAAENLERNLNKIKKGREIDWSDLRSIISSLGYRTAFICQNNGEVGTRREYIRILSLLHNVRKIVPYTDASKEAHIRILQILEQKPELLKHLPRHIRTYQI